MADRWVFAGLWEAFKWPNGDVTRSYRVITTEANALVAPIHIHNRIPVVLGEEDWPIWLGGQPGDLLVLLHAPVAGRAALSAHPKEGAASR
jgi:putative SOS response-associated peptidase YedK